MSSVHRTAHLTVAAAQCPARVIGRWTLLLPGGRRCLLRDGHDGECSRRLRR
ncbi:hypothetical protein [Micromonospora sp. NPDC005979]|uniref:hypothetical protein n=1 Tax=Micromonospora sp. NPDC005979 TaxID=3156726 RepID=UPI0033B40D3C